MKTYPELVLEYMETKLKGMWDDIPKTKDKTFLFDEIYFMFRDDSFEDIHSTGQKERVLANVEYVMDSVNKIDDDWEYKGKWFPEKDWNELDYSAIMTALDDVCDDVIEWVLEELETEQRKESGMNKLFIYRLTDGGAGFVKANDQAEALQKVKRSYGAESIYDGPDAVDVEIIGSLDDSVFNRDDIYEVGWDIQITECE